MAAASGAMAQTERQGRTIPSDPPSDVNWFDRLFGTTMVRRALSGVVLIAIAFTVVWIGDWLLAFWLAVAGARMAFEWERIVHGRGLTWAALIHGATVIIAVILMWQKLPLFALAAIFMGMTTITSFAALRHVDPKWSLVGIPYIALPTAAFMWLGMHGATHSGAFDSGQAILIWMLVSIWATDSGAYVAGNAIGGAKLWPSLSPKKTWSGLVGGIVSAAAAGFAAASFFDAPSPMTAALLSMVMSVIAQLGDLIESALKRRFKVKDAGGLIPGHGGALDRLDSHLAVAAATALLTLVVPGGPLSVSLE
jgi:phosphatidate cytidylyltransferase